jgi:hypothetical protein
MLQAYGYVISSPGHAHLTPGTELTNFAVHDIVDELISASQKRLRADAKRLALIFEDVDVPKRLTRGEARFFAQLAARTPCSVVVTSTGHTDWSRCTPHLLSLPPFIVPLRPFTAAEVEATLMDFQRCPELRGTSRTQLERALERVVGPEPLPGRYIQPFAAYTRLRNWDYARKHPRHVSGSDSNE